MPVSWNEIRSRAVEFSYEWADETCEHAEAKTFWDQFFNVFGINRRRVATFETPAKKSDGKGGFIDLLWRGQLVVEHKSRGKSLDRAFRQALDYFPGLKDRDLPRFVLVSDFANFRLYDLETDNVEEFPLSQLREKVSLFGFIAGYQTKSVEPQDPVNIRAAERLGTLHDQLSQSGYVGHALEVLLVRLLFCLFADDTAIFDKRSFQDFLEQKTKEDGTDLGPLLNHLFQILNTPQEKRQSTLDEQLAAFPYVNGNLFSERLAIADFDSRMREMLLECCALDWSRISPGIFGSLFQSIMDPNERRRLGAHYTSEENILKALNPLFLNDLREKVNSAKKNRHRLSKIHEELASIRILDPACGCGNFLVIAYRELRLIELEILRLLHTSTENRVLDVSQMVRVDVDQFFGIETEEFPAQIAQVALWLTDHQMNLQVSDVFGQYFARLPLQKTPHIVRQNALEVPWRDIVAPDQLSYIVGNPPFCGKQHQSPDQKSEVQRIFQESKGSGVLDYVACWYPKALEMVEENPAIHCAFVSTNSITQGEQATILWPPLYERGLKLNFAHRTFEWTSEASGKAAVHCVIIGFGIVEKSRRQLFYYDTPRSLPSEIEVSSLNPYLVDGAEFTLRSRRSPIVAAPRLCNGSMPNDGGNLLLSDDERNAFLKAEPQAEPYIRPFVGADEYLDGTKRWCLWLTDILPTALSTLPRVKDRVERVRAHRLKSKRPATQQLAGTPKIFGEIRQPTSDYMIVPRHISEKYPYVPIHLTDANVICGDANTFLEGADVYHFGVLSSALHMAWLRTIGGRIKNDYRYSVGVVYNNFPWPMPSKRQRFNIMEAAHEVIRVRRSFKNECLARLYDPSTMPPDLFNAHRKLDRTVDAAYGLRKSVTDGERIKALVKRYREVTSLFAAGTKP